MPRRKHVDSGAMLRLLSSREVDFRAAGRVQSLLQVTESSIRRLGLEKELVGHTGCVNCLEWNETGTVLASASDDVNFILWDPFRHRRLSIFETGHRGNIFSVKFLPKSQDSTLVTGAGDCRVRVHDVIKVETTVVCTCHVGRVKRIATAPNLPYMFWSAAEDGMIMEFDLRAPHTCSTQTNNVLINLCGHLGRHAEAKCLAINASRPELLAVGANDPYIRLYDRRMIRPVVIQYPEEGRPGNHLERYLYIHSRLENNLTDGCVQYFVAGHLPNRGASHLDKKFRNLSTTYLTFSASGTDLLVNLGGEQIYLFDINNKRDMKAFDPRLTNPSAAPGGNGFCNGWRRGGQIAAHDSETSCRGSQVPRSANIDSLRLSANTLFDMQHYTSAIREYNKALSLCSDCPLLYGNRAAAYMKRGWGGDMYAALRDCRLTLQIDPNHLKAHFRLAKCLYELDCAQEAHQCLNDFKAKFPEQAHSRACKALSMDIQTACEVREKEEKAKSQKEPSTSGESEEDARSNNEAHSCIFGREKPPEKKITEQERKWRAVAFDYEARFCGHCNTTTDIKEVNFFGREGQYIVAGSDDGSFFIWDRNTTNIVQVLKGDDSIVNCLQPHPTACLLATSGIDPVVRLWSPLPEDGQKNERQVLNLDDAASANQRRMNTDPFEVMLMNMGYRIASSVTGEDESVAMSEDESWSPNINCRPS